MKGFHKKYKLHCEALSPIHIGSGEILSRWEYVVIAGKLYYANDEFWQILHANSDKSIIEKLINQITGSSSASLTEAFNDLPNKTQLQNALEQSEIEFQSLVNRSNKPIIRNIHRFAGSPNYYIPGSSVKGSMRGAYEIEKIEEEKFKPHVKENDKKFLNGLQKAQVKAFYDDLENTFKNYAKVDSDISKKFQKVRISDISISPKDMTICPITYAKDEKGQEAAELYECIKAGTKFVITVTHAEENTEKDKVSDDFVKDVLNPFFAFHKSNFNRLLEMSQRTDLQEFYYEIYSAIKKSSSANEKFHLIRCGFGSGQMSNSILGTWKKYADDDTILWQGKAKQLLRDEKMKVGDKYPSAPKKDLSNDNPLGWMRVHKVTIHDN
jgi:CRISPR type III-A-associated RAMP protein Csm5